MKEVILMKKVNLWNDTFKIDLRVTDNPFQNQSLSRTEYFTGSLKGAIRYVLNLKEKGNVTASFYNSTGEYLKEIGR